MRRFLLGSILGLLVIVAIVVRTQTQTIMPPTPNFVDVVLPEATNEVITVDVSAYAPERYGVPNKLTGYEVLVVFTSENSECLPENVKEIVIRVVEPTVDNFLNGDTPKTLEQVRQELGGEWDFSIVGPGTNRLEMLALKEKWNADMRAGGCIRLGGPIEALFEETPPLTPDVP